MQIQKYIFHLFVLMLVAIPVKTKAWGPDGHTIVAEIALQFVNASVKQNVLNALDNMPADTIANWMDIVRSNPDYDFMKTWHYIDFDKDQTYQPSTDDNIVNRLIITYNELRHKNVLCSQQVKTDLLILFHLMGDLHQPLHTGYEEDIGGNKIAVEYDTIKAKLHQFWDEHLVLLNNISVKDCMELYNSITDKKVDSIKGVYPALWMKETRSLLDKVYDYEGHIITKKYVEENKKIVVRQLLIAGLRLANILTILFDERNMKEIASKYPNGIDAKDAAEYIGENVTACSKVYDIKSFDNLIRISAGGKFPSNTLSIIIFKDDKIKFLPSIEELYTGKTICVKGKITEFKGKAEIKVEKPEDIIVVE